MTEAELKKVAEDFRLILDPALILVAEYDGEPVAVSRAMPNLNEAIKDLNGRLIPFGLFTLIHRMRIKRPKTARLIILGIRQEFRRSKKSKYLSVLLYVEAHTRGRQNGYLGGEVGWTLEANPKINMSIELTGGEKYKTYRPFEKTF